MNIHWIYRAYYKVSKTIYYIHVYECQVPCQELEIQKLAGPSSCLQEAIQPGISHDVPAYALDEQGDSLQS